jgi:hypothetical protein
MNTYHYNQSFEDLLNVLDDEQLVRLAYRLRKASKTETALLLESELKERDGAIEELP